MKKFLPVTILLVIALLLAACGGANEVANNNNVENNAEVNSAPVVEEEVEEMPEELPSIAEIAAGDENFSTLVTALSAAGLVDTLAGEGEFTVFAPTNAAFDALGETLDAVLADSELLTRVLLYHVVSGVVPAEAALTLDGQMVETLSGDEFAVSLQDGDLYIDNAKVTMTDIEASNGIIHVIDAVLVPGQDEMADDAMAEELPSIAEIAAGDENFSTLVTALDAAGLVDTLAGEGAYTVFAPTNEAFDALGETLDAVLADNELLTRVLLYHVVDGVVPAETALTLDGQMVETLSGDKFSVSLQDGDLYIDNAKVTMTDIEASNGIIHVIDAVIVPSDDAMAEELPSIAEIAAGDENFSTLVTALDAAGLVETLAGEGAYTVFAPTNEAFDALGETLDAVLADNELLTRVLLYHVVDGVVPAETALTLDGQMVETLSGDMFEVSLQDGDLYIDNAKVTMTDIEASNGIIHVIDAVLVPAD